VIPISTGLAVTPLQRILNLEQAFAIEADPAFAGGDYYEGARPDRGLALARMIAHKTFISLRTLTERARGEVVRGGGELTSYGVSSPEESYMLHQGRKFVRRFDANSYLRILEAWQRFDLLAGSGAEDLTKLFGRCRDQRYLTFSIDSDVSFYPEEQAEMVGILKAAGVETVRMTVHSEKGHDSFLLEPELYTPMLQWALG
jgi:homoserine O-acetyltransferase